MSAKKTRSDSVLGTLPPERQAAIAGYAREHSLEETVDWLRADGINTSRTALSEWYSSWSLRSQFALAEQDTLNLIDLLKRRRPHMPQTEMEQWASEYFQVQAVKRDDPKTFLDFWTARSKATIDKAKLEQKQVSLAHDERRIRLLEQRAAQADAASKVVESPLSAEEKQAKLRQIFGMT